LVQSIGLTTSFVNELSPRLAKAMFIDIRQV